jgi:carboxymethylenebutenolidase
MSAIRALALSAALTLLSAGCATQSAQDSTSATMDRVAAEHAGDTPVPAAAADGAPVSGVLTQTIIYGRTGARALEGFVAWPEQAVEPPPAVMLIHEWWGLNDNIKEMARKLAAEGYTALAVDLYAGRTATNGDDARALVEKTLADENAVDENLRQAYAFLKDSAQAPRIGSIGWCFGGGISLRAALLMPELDATVVYYGMLEQDRERLATLDTPILGLFGQRDESIPPREVERFQQTMRALGKPLEVRIYPGAGHAFANPSGTTYEPETAADAWKRTIAFLAKNLSPAPPQ